MKSVLLVAVCLFCSNVFAGNWKCAMGESTSEEIDVIAVTGTGDASGITSTSVKISVAGLPGFPYSSEQESREAGELARILIGKEAPASTARLRIMNEEVSPLVFKSFIRMVYMQLPTELPGLCTYSESAR
jgi:hypothetical protein